MNPILYRKLINNFKLEEMELSIINGASAGNHSVSNILTSSTLKKVFYIKVNQSQTSVVILGTSVLQTDSDTLNSQDLTSEFSITSNGIINNTSGTNTTDGILIITWI